MERAMSPEEIKRRGRRVVEELFNQGDLAVVDQLFDAGYHGRIVADKHLSSGAAFGARVTDLRDAFPDLHAHVRDQVVENGTLVQRMIVTGSHCGQSFRGLPASGGRIRVDVVDIARLTEEGRIVQQWTLLDTLTLLRQLGSQLFTEAVN
jgi:predicted ester cyclase